MCLKLERCWGPNNGPSLHEVCYTEPKNRQAGVWQGIGWVVNNQDIMREISQNGICSRRGIDLVGSLGKYLQKVTFKVRF